VLSELLRTLDITVSTRWRQAHDIILSSPEFRADADLQKVETLDILTVYDDYSRQLEQEHDEEYRRFKVEQIRKARKARDAFKVLLSEIGLTRLSKWKETMPKIKDDERYKNLLGLSGSSPLDLWMDAVDDLSEEVERASEKIEKAMARDGNRVKIETTYEEFERLVKEAQLDNQIEDKLKKEVFAMVSVLLCVSRRSISGACGCRDRN
jgi:pre-mRNA-processing factor 40